MELLVVYKGKCVEKTRKEDEKKPTMMPVRIQFLLSGKLNVID
jgi:hypothetical protein